MRIVTRHLDCLANEVELEGGHQLLVDEPPDRGGADTGPRPTQLLGASLASCIAITVQMYAGRKGWDVSGMEVSADVEYEGYAPSRFSVAVALPAGLDAAQRERLLAIAGKCPVHRVISQATPVTISAHPEAA
jgi:putative redox protein